MSGLPAGLTDTGTLCWFLLSISFGWFHRGLQFVALQLMDIKFSFLRAFPDEHAFSLFMYFQHVLLGFLAFPTKNFHEYMRNIYHQIYRVVPADNIIGRGQPVVRTGFLFYGWSRSL